MVRVPITVLVVILIAASFAIGDDKPTPESASSQYPVLAGIGCALAMTDAGPKIGVVVPGSVAEKSGKLQKGDRILTVRDGDRTIVLKGKTMGEVVSLIRGPVGTTITLEVLSADGEARSLVTLKREAVPLDDMSSTRTYDALIGKPAPAVTFTTLEKPSPILLSNLRGQVVVVDFWASWCGTCYAPVDRMQKLSRAHPEWKGRVALFAATVDTDLSRAGEVVAARKWNETTHLSLAPEKLAELKLVTVPVVIIIARDGKIAAVGDPHSVSIEKEVAKLLADR